MLLTKDNLVSSLSRDCLSTYLMRQVENCFPDGAEISADAVLNAVDVATERYVLCAQHVANRYFGSDDEVLFNHLNADQYCMFLYLLSHSLYKNDEIELASRFYYLNKVLHGIDAFYEVELPDIFYLGHPLGTILGRATYSNYFVATQNCTVGNNAGHYPVFGEGVALYAGAIVAGGCDIGANTQVSAQCFIREESVDGDCVVFGHSPDLTCKPSEKTVKSLFFKCDGAD